MAIPILIISETIQNKPARPVEDLARFAEALSPDGQTELTVVMTGRDVRLPATHAAAATGLDVIILEDPRFFLPNPELLSMALSDVIKETDPHYICFTHTPRACLTAAKLATALGASLITGVDSLLHNGKPVFRRSIFNGKFVMDTEHQENPTILTVLPGACSGSAPVDRVKTPGNVMKRYLPPICKDPAETGGFIPVELNTLEAGDNALDDADVIVSVGMGMGTAENIDVARQLASLLKNAAIGASRIACDMGWLSHARQIGETGKSVAPKLYLALGISGSAQHVAGIKNAQMIIAVNKDPNAAIFAAADYGIVEDLNTFLPLLIDKLQQD